MSKVKVAVIGYGHLGKWHCQKAQASEFSEFVAIVEQSERNQAMAKEKHPNVKVVNSIDDIINEVDAFMVVTPTSTHFSIVEKLLKAGKHVFCEKPLCSTSEEVLKLEKSLNPKQKLQVGHSERYHAIWDKIGNELREIETPFYLKINRFAPFKGRATDVDVVQDLMIHDIDLMLYLFNEKPISLESKAYKMRTDKWDHCIAEFKFANGSKAVITSGRNSTYEVREFELATESGVKRVDLMNNHFAQTNKTDYGLSNSEQVFVQEETYSKRDHLMIEHDLFYQSIINNTKEFVDFKSGKEAVYLVSEVLRSVNQEDLVILKYE